MLLARAHLKSITCLTHSVPLHLQTPAKYGHYELRRQERIKIINDERTAICQYLSAVKSGGAMDDTMLSKKTNFNVTMNETKVVTATVKFDPSKSTKR